MFDVIREPLVDALGRALLQSVWQCAFVAGLVAIALSLVGKRDPRIRYGIAVLGLMTMLVLPVGTGLVAYRGQAEGRPPASRSVAPVPAPASPLAGDDSMVSISSPSSRVPEDPRRLSAWGLPSLEAWQPTLVLGWLLGVVALSMRTIGGWFLLHRLRGRCVSASPHAIELVRRMARRLRVTGPVKTLESACVRVPAAIGFFRPAILLPAGLVAGLSPAQLEAVIAHELAHVRRHDFLVNLFQTAAETLLFYHPGIWWISRRIRVEREQCADDLAVAACGDPVLYAEALSELESLRSGGALAVAATGGSLADRIRRILGQPARHDTRSSAWLAAFAVTALLLTFIVSPGDTSAVGLSAGEALSHSAGHEGAAFLTELIEPELVEPAGTARETRQGRTDPQPEVLPEEIPEASEANAGPTETASAAALQLPDWTAPVPERLAKSQDYTASPVLQPFGYVQEGEAVPQPFAYTRQASPAPWTFAYVQEPGRIGLTIRDGEERGVVVGSVEEGSPAGEAGIEAGDLITEYNETNVMGVKQLQRFVSETPPGRTVPLTIVRDGQERQVRITLPPERRGSGEPLGSLTVPRAEITSAGDLSHLLSITGRGELGLRIETMTPELREFFGAEASAGVLVAAIDFGSIAGAAGVRVGDVIVGVDGNRVDSPADLRNLARTVLATENPVSLRVVRDRAELEVVIEPEAETPGVGRGVSLRLGDLRARVEFYSSETIQ